MREQHAYIVGGGIAGLSAAALLVRDGGFRGNFVHVIEGSELFGGSLDGAGDARSGFVIRGGRMFEAHFGCTFDLFGSIPTLEHEDLSVSDEIHDFTRRIVSSSKSRLVESGSKIESPPLGLGLRDKWDLARLTQLSESAIGTRTIADYFRPAFFETNFWLIWSTMFAFQSWHSLVEFRRYQRRFMHLMPGFNRLEGIHRTRLNQYDSLIRPLLDWLREKGVDLRTDAPVTDVHFTEDEPVSAVTGIEINDAAGPQHIDVGKQDLVLITLGSMTEGSSLGTMNEAPRPKDAAAKGSWALWRKIAARSERFGRPETFCDAVDRTTWESFTVTVHDPTFFDFMERFTGNPAGTGGLVTFKDSNWRMSVVLAHQPHFLDQPENVQVFWGYGLWPEKRGNKIDKPMSACSGGEILEELFFHLPVGDARDEIIETANCIPCRMPFITSHFMPRSDGDRPAVIPEGAENFGFLGQFCELADDTVFTVEYSVRSAQTAVYGLLDLPREVTPLYRGYRDPAVVVRAARALW